MVRSGKSVMAGRMLAAALLLWSAPLRAFPAQSASTSSHSAGAASPQAASPQAAPLVTDTIWYVTNRAPKTGGWQDERALDLRYGVRSFQVVPKPGARGSVPSVRSPLIWTQGRAVVFAGSVSIR